MLSIKRISVSILLILGILLSACAQATPQPSEPSVVKETVVVREVVDPVEGDAGADGGVDRLESRLILRVAGGERCPA